MNEIQIIDERNLLGKEFKIYGDFDKTPKVTGKGQQYFINLFLNKKA